MKKAVFFSIDAIVALFIVFITIIAVSISVSHSQKQTQVPGDLIRTFSLLKVGDIDNVYFKQLIEEGLIKDLNKSVLEQIGEFYVTNITLARLLADSLLENISINDNLGIWYGDELLACKNKTSFDSAKNIKVERQLISGLRAGESVTGFSSRAYLESQMKSRYFYFGGYVGDGNISVNINYSGEIEAIKIEITSNEDFDIYINNIFSGHYQNSSSQFNPAIYNLTAYKENFNSGENLIEFVGDTNSLFIAGGYIKIDYKNSTDFYTHKNQYYFPGISGLINIYDGFYIPGQLNEMNIFLHYDSNYSIFLNIGNTTVYNGRDEEETSVSITNSELSALLDYNELVNKTIPLRLGLENVSYVSTIRRQVDVYSVTDLSGSMNDCGEYDYDIQYCSYQYCTIFAFGVCWSWSSTQCDYTGSCSGDQCGTGYSRTRNHEIIYGCNRTLLDLAKEANKEFIDVVLENQGNKVGLIGYATSVIGSAFHNLSDNQTSLNNKVDDWTASGGTCICCGIDDAMIRLSEINDNSRMKVIVVMSDGEANYNCNGNYGIANAKQTAIDKACEAYNDYNITVHAVGFGSNADEATLQAIADCGNGEYYFGNASELAELYRQIAQDVIEASYFEQTIEATSGDILTVLYPDSYIEFNYTKPFIPYGFIVSLEQQFSNSTHGFFSIPENSSVIDANIISYSGPRWTSNAIINNQTIYNILDYHGLFINIGDPYKINIPIDKINLSQENSVELYTAISPGNNTVGSENNKIIYTIIKNFVSYSPISPFASGCIWEIKFEDDTTLNIKVPSDYSGTQTCSYEDGIYSENNAVHIAAYELLRKLDFDLNGKIDFKFAEGELVISSLELVGIPYSWSTEVQIRRWD